MRDAFAVHYSELEGQEVDGDVEAMSKGSPVSDPNVKQADSQPAPEG